MVDERIPERKGVLEQTQEGGVGGLLSGLADMMLPQAGLPGQKDLGSIFNDFVEFSALGDVGDIAAAVDPNSGLDPLERIIAASPFIGIGAAGVRQGYRRYAGRAAEAATQAQLQAQVRAMREATQEAVSAPSMTPPPDQSYDLTNPKLEDLGGADPTPIQGRQQAAKFEQLAEESRSPFSRGVFRAETWEQLTHVVDPGIAELDATPGREGQGSMRAARVASALRGVGTAIIAQVREPELYGPAEADATWYGPGEREFVAAKIAVAKYQKAIDLGLVEETSTMTLGLELGIGKTRLLERVINLEVATSGIVGPDLEIGTGARIAQIVESEVGTEDYRVPTVQVMYGLVDELLPTERVWDWERAYPANSEGLRKRQQAIDFDAFNGVGASNIARAIYHAPPQPGRSSIGVDSLRDNNWYPRMNRTAQILAEETPYSVTQISGILSALSASTPWVPDNLIGAIHTVIQTGTDHLPNTAEYNRIFERAVLEAGWGNDLYKAVSEQGGLGAAEGVAQMFDQDPAGPGGQIDQQGLVGWYAQPENVTSPEGNIAGVADATKKEKVDLILKANLPPWLVLRGMKTNTFHRLGSDPSLADLATIDTHSDRVYFGSAWVDRPLAHEGYTDPKGIKPDEIYHDPITGERIKGSEVIESIESMGERAGWTRAQRDRWLQTLAKFPSATAQARYVAQQRAHLLVRDEFGVEAGHQIQAASWGTAQAWDRGRLSKTLEGIKADELAEFRRIAGQAVLDTALYSHVEGNPVMERTPAGLSWNVNGTLAGTLPTVKQLDAARKGIQRPASGRVSTSIVNVGETNGTVTPYADPEVRGVPEVLRHATPSGLRVGKFHRYISNKARKVLSVLDHVSEVGEYRRADGRLAAGFVTTGTSTQPHPGMVAGDRLVVLVDPKQASRIHDILNDSMPLTREEGDVGTTAQGTSRNKITAEDLRRLTDAQLGEVLKNNDWVALTAYRGEFNELQNANRNRQLRRDIEKKGGVVVEATGRYPGETGVVEEPSFFVTGLSYADAVALGKKYDQEAVAARHGMLNMDGTYHPVQEEVAFGEQVDPDSHTALSTGQAFSFSYDWDQLESLPEDPDFLADQGTVESPMRQITIDLGGEYGGLNWREIELLMQRIGRVGGARTRLYTHSLNRVPAGYTKAVESVVTDMNGVTGSVLHRTGDTYARHQAEVWIPEWENATLSEDGFEGERARRDPLDARSIMEVDEQAGLIWFDQDLAISVPPEATVTLGQDGPVFRSLRLNGSPVRELIVDTNGPVPMLIAGQGGTPPAPGRTMVTLSRGEVSKITPYADADWADARDALSAAGLIPDGKKIKVEYATKGNERYRPTAEWDYSPYDSIDVTGADLVPQTPDDAAMQARLTEAIPTMGKIRLGPANVAVRTNIEQVLLGLHGHTSRYAAFIERHGSIPDEVWLPTRSGEATGIHSARISVGGGRSSLAAVTFYDPGGIVINEDMIVNSYNRGVAPAGRSTYIPDGVSEVEITLVHEIGHMLTRAGVEDSHALAKQAHDDLRGVGEILVSAYGATSPAEFFAEAFSRVVFEPDKAHPVLHNLVDGVLKLNRDWYDVDLGDLE